MNRLDSSTGGGWPSACITGTLTPLTLIWWPATGKRSTTPRNGNTADRVTPTPRYKSVMATTWPLNRALSRSAISGNGTLPTVAKVLPWPSTATFSCSHKRAKTGFCSTWAVLPTSLSFLARSTPAWSLPPTPAPATPCWMPMPGSSPASLTMKMARWPHGGRSTKRC